MREDETKTFRIRVSGLVQGVGFRAFVVRAADELGIRGTVQNAADGTVEIEAQGPARSLERFLLQLKKGPRMARVDDLRVETVRDVSIFSSFEMRW